MRVLKCLFTSRLFALAVLLFSGCATIKDAGEFRRNHIEEYQEELKSRNERIQGTLTLEQCIALAMEFNYDARQADVKRELAKLDRNTSFSSFLPTLTGTASITNWEFAPSMSGMQTSDATIRSASLKLTVPLLVPVAYFMFQNSKQGLAIADLAAHYTRQSVILQTSAAYYQVLITQKQIRTLETQTEAAKKLLDRLSGLAENGLATNWQKGEANYLYTARLASLQNARRKLVADKGALLKLMGMNPLATIKLADISEPVQLPKESMDEMLYTAIQAHPSLAIADQQSVIAENNVRKAIADFFPIIGVIGNSDWTSNSFADHAQQLYISLAGSMDLFKGFTKFFAYKSAKFKQESARLDREATMLSVMLQVVKSVNTLYEAQSMLGVVQAEHDYYQGKYKDYEAKFKEGLLPIHEVLDAQSNLFQAEGRLADAQYATYLAKAHLDMALGTLAIPDEEENPAIVKPEPLKN